jgi:hypothetical protein
MADGRMILGDKWVGIPHHVDCQLTDTFIVRPSREYVNRVFEKVLRFKSGQIGKYTKKGKR